MLMAKDVSRTLAGRAMEIVSYLLPNGKKQGNEWCVGNVLGASGDSLKIHLSGDKTGVWCDFATGEGGDLLDLWAMSRGIDISEALKQACEYLGIKRAPLSGKKPEKFKRPEPQVKAVSEESNVRDYLQNIRYLSADTLYAFRIAEHKGDIAFPSFRNGTLISVKYLKLNRENGRKVMYVEKDCEPCLFGWQALPSQSRMVTICEGEIDAMSLREYGIAALSVPFGAGTGRKHEWIEYEFDNLAMFDDIFICMDNDDEGKKAASEIVERLGAHRCRVVELPFKDPNECLQNRISQQDMEYFFRQAVTIDPMELKDSYSATKKVQDWINPPGGKQDGYYAPFQKSTDKILFRPHEFSVWTGINGHGKSQFVGQVLLDMMNQGARICLASLELRPEIFLGRLAKQATAMSNPSNEFIQTAMEWFSGKLWYIDVLGKIDLNRLIEVFQYGLRRYGIDVFIIDSFMMLNGVYEDDFKSQKMCIEQICEFKNQNYAQVHLIVHPRKGADESSVPGKLDAKGTGAITDAADNCFTVWRNKGKEAVIEKQKNHQPVTDKEIEKLAMPDALWRCDKQRNGLWEGYFGLWYDKSTFQYLEWEDKKPTRYVTYSCLE